MNKDLIAIFEYLEREKGIKRDVVVSAIEEALRIAARKSIKEAGDATVKIDSKTGDIDIFVQKQIVEKVEDREKEISIEEAKKLTDECEVGQWLEISIMPEDFGRIAAQTARQVISQKLKGAERDVIYEEYRHRENEIISGTIKRFTKGRTMIVDLGKVEAILPDTFYPKTERYRIGERVQALLYEVKDTDAGGAEVILTRSHSEFVKALFNQEVPELSDGIIAIEKIAREPGYRTKIAVRSFDPKIDAVGTCVGVRGTRIKNIIKELNNEKIDVFPYADDPIILLKNALSPIEIKRFKQRPNVITIIVNDDDYPLVIGKRGMNARLLSQIINSEINVYKITEYFKLTTLHMAELADSDNPTLDNPLKIEGISSLLIGSLVGAGYTTLRQLLLADPLELPSAVPGINYLDLADKILEQTKKK